MFYIEQIELSGIKVDKKTYISRDEIDDILKDILLENNYELQSVDYIDTWDDDKYPDTFFYDESGSESSDGIIIICSEIDKGHPFVKKNRQ